MSVQLPTVRYHTTVYIEENQRMFEIGSDNYEIQNVVKVINGTLESVLHLIGYSFAQIREINRELSIKYQTNQKIEFELSFLENQISEELKSQRPSRAHVVEYEDRLYGVIVDEGRARVCGQINRIVSTTKDVNQSSVLNRGIKLNRNTFEGQPLKYEDEVKKHIESGQHFVIVSENGMVFVVPNDNPNGHHYQNPLTLVLGNGFVIIEEPTVHWIRSKQQLKNERREDTQLSPHESIVASFAAVCISSNGIRICGTGSVVNIKNIKEFYAFL